MNTREVIATILMVLIVAMVVGLMLIWAGVPAIPAAYISVCLAIVVISVRTILSDITRR